jgi:phosphohistidine phosphatase
VIAIYLVRHGIAADPAAGIPDDDRPLTPKGRRRFRGGARAFARLGEVPTFVFTSPLVRAVQTAEILAGALKADAVEILEPLRSGAPVRALLGELGRRLEDGESAALVGHDPQMTALVATLGGLDARDAARVVFRKGAIVRIDVGALPAAKPSQPRWHLKPRSRTFAEGLPLSKKARPPG